MGAVCAKLVVATSMLMGTVNGFSAMWHKAILNQKTLPAALCSRRPSIQLMASESMRIQVETGGPDGGGTRARSNSVGAQTRKPNVKIIIDERCTSSLRSPAAWLRKKDDVANSKADSTSLLSPTSFPSPKAKTCQKDDISGSKACLTSSRLPSLRSLMAGLSKNEESADSIAGSFTRLGPPDMMAVGSVKLRNALKRGTKTLKRELSCEEMQDEIKNQVVEQLVDMDKTVASFHDSWNKIAKFAPHSPGAVTAVFRMTSRHVGSHAHVVLKAPVSMTDQLLTQAKGNLASALLEHGHHAHHQCSNAAMHAANLYHHLDPLLQGVTTM